MRLRHRRFSLEHQAAKFSRASAVGKSACRIFRGSTIAAHHLAQPDRKNAEAQIVRTHGANFNVASASTAIPDALATAMFLARLAANSQPVFNNEWAHKSGRMSVALIRARA